MDEYLKKIAEKQLERQKMMDDVLAGDPTNQPPPIQATPTPTPPPTPQPMDQTSAPQIEHGVDMRALIQKIRDQGMRR